VANAGLLPSNGVEQRLPGGRGAMGSVDSIVVCLSGRHHSGGFEGTLRPAIGWAPVAGGYAMEGFSDTLINSPHRTFRDGY
jgi:hypothetical protein